MLDKKKIALIHIIKDELRLSDEAYRDLLEKATGKRSSKDLDEDQFRTLMNHFMRSSHYRIRKDGMTIRQKIYIKSLATQLEWDENHLINFIRKYYHEKDLAHLSKMEASKLIESLKHIQQHQAHQQEGTQ